MKAFIVEIIVPSEVTSLELLEAINPALQQAMRKRDIGSFAYNSSILRELELKRQDV